MQPANQSLAHQNPKGARPLAHNHLRSFTASKLSVLLRRSTDIEQGIEQLEVHLFEKQCERQVGWSDRC